MNRAHGLAVRTVAPVIAAWALAAIGIAACGGPEPSPPDGAAQPSTAYLARHGPMNGGPAAIVQGTLVERDGCLLLEVAGGAALACGHPTRPRGSSTA